MILGSFCHLYSSRFHHHPAAAAVRLTYGPSTASLPTWCGNSLIRGCTGADHSWQVHRLSAHAARTAAGCRTAHGDKHRRQQQQQATNDINSSDGVDGLVLSARHHAPMHPGLVISISNKGRGRKKKQQQQQQQHPVSVSLRGQGRPKKQESSEQPVQQHLDPAIAATLAADAISSRGLQLKRGRGRPRKLDLAAAAAAATASEDKQRHHQNGDITPASSSSSKSSQGDRKRQIATAVKTAMPTQQGQRMAGPTQQVEQQQQQQQPQPLSRVDSSHVAAAAAAGIPPPVDDLQQQQLQQHPVQQRASNDSAAAGPSSRGSDALHDTPGTTKGSSPSPTSTEWCRSEIERLYDLPAAVDPDMNPLSACATATDSADEGPADARQWPQQHDHGQQPYWQGPKGFQLTSTIRGRSPTNRATPTAGSDVWQDQDQQHHDTSSSSTSSSGGCGDLDLHVGMVHHHQLHDSHDVFPGSRHPLEPSPLEPPVHPEMQYEVQLQEEQQRLQERKQLLQQLKKGEMLYQVKLSSPDMRSLAYMTPNTLAALQAARQLVQKHPELHSWIAVQQQDFEHALQVAHAAAHELRKTQELISKLESIVEEEEVRAGRHSGNYTSSRAASQDSRRMHSSSGNACNGPEGSGGSAATSAGDDDCQQRATESLNLLRRLLPQFESAEGLPEQQQQQHDTEPDDPREDYQWG